MLQFPYTFPFLLDCMVLNCGRGYAANFILCGQCGQKYCCCRDLKILYIVVAIVVAHPNLKS
jgi:hypothetical protein